MAVSQEKQHIYEFGPFRLDVQERLLLRDGESVALTPRALDLLVVFVESRGHLLEKDELMRRLWPDSFVEEGNLAQNVSLIRKSLGETELERFIETVPRRGYRFVASVSEVAYEGPDLVVREEVRSPITIEQKEATTTGDVATARSTSSAEYLIGEIGRRKRGVALGAAAVLVVVAALAYHFYARSGGEAIDSVAVLPFVNAGGDPNTEYLSDGISDSVINSLSRLPNMKVISLSSVLRYKGQPVDPQAVGRELNVKAVLMGRLTQQGDGLAISTELVDARDNRRLWGEQYSSKLAGILVVQGEIARQISDGLRLRLSGEEKKQLSKQYTENTEAYQLYILGRHYFSKQTKEAFEKSIEYYEQSIKKDPNYALAYTGLALSYSFMGNRGFWTTRESEQKQEWAALKALELDDTLAEGHALLGVTKFFNFDWAGAEKELKRALELDPNSPLVNVAYSNYLANVGRPDEALSYAIRAQETDPMSQPGTLAYAYFLAHQYGKAIELFRKVLEKNPNNAQPHALIGEAYLAKEMYGESVAEIQKAVALDNTPQRWDRHPMLAYTYAMTGRRDEALKILNEQNRLAKQEYISPYNFAIIYTGLGDKDRAFEWLEKGVEEKTPLIFRLKTRPIFEPLRSDPRYAELLRRMNLEP